jgi:hypothetical protein
MESIRTMDEIRCRLEGLALADNHPVILAQPHQPMPEQDFNTEIGPQANKHEGLGEGDREMPSASNGQASGQVKHFGGEEFDDDDGFNLQDANTWIVTKACGCKDGKCPKNRKPHQHQT